MRQNFSITALAVLLTIALVAPAAFLVAPEKVYAINAEITADFSWPSIKRTVESTLQTIKQELISVNSFTTALATEAQWLNASVLQPLAFALSGDLMKMLTSGVIQFVIGKANGTGVPQFVTDVQKSLQTVGDAKALAFFDQFGRNSNSPFASSITSSLRKDYLSKTSLAGFWAANMNTLAQSTPSYAPGYLAGNWQQGGLRAWFALTTQTQNNPYTFYPTAQEQLGSLIGPGAGGATGARIAELNWGQGFASWCGAREGTTEDNDGTAMEESTTEDNDGTGMEVAGGINPGDPCIKDGVSGTIKTPGSVIVATLNKVLGGQQDQIVRMGNVGPEINSILKNISTVMQTANFAMDILGNASLGTATGGLLGADEPSGTNSTSRLQQFQTSPGNLGVTQTQVYQGAATLPASGSDMTNRIAEYQAAWGTIGAAANAASTTVASLADFCIAQQKTAPLILSDESTQDLANFMRDSTAQAAAARSAIANVIAPVLARVAAAASTTAAAQAMVAKIQSELTSDSETVKNAYLTDIQLLQTMSPTALDIANVRQDAQAFNMAAASPAGSLNVAGGSLLDQISLISTNAAALKKTVCTPASSANANAGDFGGS